VIGEKNDVDLSFTLPYVGIKDGEPVAHR
jgi:hypothetical protein